MRQKKKGGCWGWGKGRVGGGKSCLWVELIALALLAWAVQILLFISSEQNDGKLCLRTWQEQGMRDGCGWGERAWGRGVLRVANAGGGGDSLSHVITES